ncbi:RagB/SusD family nutrient uptake outer membrane protein [Sphingobacterium sp. SGR-19]|uniref:RagB/SusD family nutrient uptake outer membrane protein n=1 Tax=Sphingobacterium sp. SGR-19 TaxID=2710886 RepID=UPI0013EAA145|nr:RagB/SusD family nutrient uptake outer membrane protein [Sphingobacterium sp. SGR-19]NGM65459.1 RagB/SusD family nutrient uptake outer membrane protein [Sphingobacterium sp. SGR-19]
MTFKYIYSALSLATVLTITSCSIEPELTDVYTEEVAWSSESNVELSLNKFYPLIGQLYYTNQVNQDAYSDVLKRNTPTHETNLQILGVSLITPGANLLDNWSWGYRWIRDCNEFLDGLYTRGGQLPETYQRIAEGEVLFFRAYVYFELAKRYGASIILYKGLNDGEPKARSTPEEVWDFIAADLDKAADQLPPTVPAAKKGKLTKGAALGLKARAMLYAKRWKASSDAVEALKDLQLYDLHPDYAALFNQRRSEGLENKESILEFGFQSPNFTYSFDYFFAPTLDGGYAQISPTDNLVRQYQMADGTDFNWSNPAHAASPYEGREPRFYASILYNGAPWKGRVIETFVDGKDGYAVGGGTTSTGYYMRKLFDEELTDLGRGELTFYFMRYAEALLIYAEALAEQDRLTDGLEALNQVRRRAGFTKDLTATNKGNLLNLIRRERMVELAFEGHRFWDLRRWNLATTELNGKKIEGVKPIRTMVNDVPKFMYELVDVDNGRTRVYPEKYNRFPIPLTELQRNPIIEQFDEWK